jgi:hypothetical protein
MTCCPIVLTFRSPPNVARRSATSTVTCRLHRAHAKVSDFVGRRSRRSSGVLMLLCERLCGGWPCASIGEDVRPPSLFVDFRPRSAGWQALDCGLQRADDLRRQRSFQVTTTPSRRATPRRRHDAEPARLPSRIFRVALHRAKVVAVPARLVQPLGLVGPLTVSTLGTVVGPTHLAVHWALSSEQH